MLHIEKICPTEKLFSSTNESNDQMQKMFENLGYVRSGFITSKSYQLNDIRFRKRLEYSWLKSFSIYWGDGPEIILRSLYP